MSPQPIVIQLSGGVASWAAARLIIDAEGSDHVTLLFADTLIEDDDLYRFLGDAEKNLGLPIERTADGRTPWELFRSEKFIGNTRVDICSRVLKRELLRSWLDEHHPDGVRVAVGIDWTEIHRCDRITEGLRPHVAVYPLIDAGIDKVQAFEMLAETGIPEPDLYKLGFEHNNCGGFCVKAGQAQFARLLITKPERYAMHEAEEEATRDFFGKDVAILRDRRKASVAAWNEEHQPEKLRKAIPMTLREFRERVATGDYDASDIGGCGCATDDDGLPSALMSDILDETAVTLRPR